MSKVAAEYLARKSRERDQNFSLVRGIWYTCSILVVVYALMAM
jgi:hypothetical protein